MRTLLLCTLLCLGLAALISASLDTSAIIPGAEMLLFRYREMIIS